MQIVENAVLGALERAKPFIDENATQLSAAVDFTTARKRLDDVIASFTTHAVDQSVHDRTIKGETAKQEQLRVQLATDIMRPIAEIARRNLRTTPEFKSLHMPRGVAGPAFLASAKGMAEAAAIYKDTLIERGLPADFLEQFQTALTSYAASVNDREQSRTLRIGATRGLALQAQEGRNVLKVLDALVNRALRGNPALLATWRGARMIHRRPGGKAAPAPAPASTTPATAAAPSVSSTSPTAVVTAVAA